MRTGHTASALDRLLQLEKAARLPRVSYADLIRLAGPDREGCIAFLTKPACDQARELAAMATANEDAELVRRLEAELASMRRPQFVCLEHMRTTLQTSALGRNCPWLCAALSTDAPRTYGGRVGKWIR